MPSPRPIRLAILDDSPFVRAADGRIHPVDATFPRFAAAVARELGGTPATYLVPVRDLAPGAPAPPTPPVDEACLRIVPTLPFDGIAGYVRDLPRLLPGNAVRIRRALRDADLLWIKAPASNAAVAAVAAAATGTPRFTYVVGSARAVAAAGERHGPAQLSAVATGAGWDAVTAVLRRSGPSLELDGEVFTSAFDAEDLPAPRIADGRSPSEPFRVVWTGRLAPGKGLPDLLEAVARARATGLDLRLQLIGDGRGRDRLEELARAWGVAGITEWTTYLGERRALFEALGAADLFVSPSHAEGVPKTVVEAMAAGVPVVATAVGAVPKVLAYGRRGVLLPPRRPDLLAAAIVDLAADPDRRARLADRAVTWARERTTSAQARRLVAWIHEHVPLPPREPLPVIRIP